MYSLTIAGMIRGRFLERRLLIVQTLPIVVTVSFGVLSRLMSGRLVYCSRAVTSASVTS